MDKIRVRLVLEILGRPAEHIKSSLSLLIEKLMKEKGLIILEKDIKDPIPVEKAKDLFTTFAEVTAEFDSIEHLLGIIFAYMPANIEIISPEQITFKNSDLSLLTNRLAIRLHEYDALAKKFMQERSFLIEKLKEHAPQLFKQKTPTEATEKNKENSKKSSAKKKKKKD